MTCPYCTNEVIDDTGFCGRCGRRLAPFEVAVAHGHSPFPFSTNDVSVAWPNGTVLLDEFEVERELGVGGMGRVYLVKSRLSGYQFAVKTTMLPDADSPAAFSRRDPELDRSY